MRYLQQYDWIETLDNDWVRASLIESRCRRKRYCNFNNWNNNTHKFMMYVLHCDEVVGATFPEPNRLTRWEVVSCKMLPIHSAIKT